MEVICFCHLRWNFVYQRPQHLMSQVGSDCPVIFIEEPVFDDAADHLEVRNETDSITILVPHLQNGKPYEEFDSSIIALLRSWNSRRNKTDFIAWFYTPMAVPLLAAFPHPELIVYDCMDELSAFDNAPLSLKTHEDRLFSLADVVFTGGQSLYRAKKGRHGNIHPFPSSIDKEHFGKARMTTADPADQAGIPFPRIGFFGVIDERLDIGLIGKIASSRPDFQLVIIGPVVKIDPAKLPRNANIHYLGGKSYGELPGYLANWDVALIPFAINNSTKYISPTKTPEYLAGGKPVVSTPITDVIDPYGDSGLVSIASTGAEFVNGIERALQQKNDPFWLEAVDSYLEHCSWEKTWRQMFHHIVNAYKVKSAAQKVRKVLKYV